ncbi:MAG TPA: cupin domain-containing protein [Candidatus Sulfotelmatobacter sp.]|nr:cupin domain-containing protein [Candidatus Sulfotelmatobacter sp.]
MSRTKDADSFADFLAPVTVERFRRDYLDQAPLHIQGAADKFAGVMSWDILNRLLDMTAIWSSQSLQLALDCQMIPPERYCQRGHDRAARDAWRPQPARVRALIRQGASVLLNDIDTLTPGLRGIADLLERAFGAKVQINLYCSWRERQAFPSHFDTHDVFAVHIAGAKRWTVYRGRADQPVDHPTWKALGQAHHQRAKGDVLMTVDLQPGDILYLPRGQYHDALATGDSSIHLAVGVNEPLGLDVVTLLFEAGATAAPLYRRRLPPAHDRAALEGRLHALAADVRHRLADPGFRAALETFQAGYGYRRGGFPSQPGFRDDPVKGPVKGIVTMS